MDTEFKELRVTNENREYVERAPYYDKDIWIDSNEDDEDVIAQKIETQKAIFDLPNSEHVVLELDLIKADSIGHYSLDPESEMVFANFIKKYKINMMYTFSHYLHICIYSMVSDFLRHYAFFKPQKSYFDDIFTFNMSNVIKKASEERIINKKQIDTENINKIFIERICNRSDKDCVYPINIESFISFKEDYGKKISHFSSEIIDHDYIRQYENFIGKQDVINYSIVNCIKRLKDEISCSDAVKKYSKELNELVNTITNNAANIDINIFIKGRFAKYLLEPHEVVEKLFNKYLPNNTVHKFEKVKEAKEKIIGEINIARERFPHIYQRINNSIAAYVRNRTINCKSCGYENNYSAKYCCKCGSCLDLEARLCTECGTAMEQKQ